MKPIPLLDLDALHADVRQDMNEAVAKVIDGGHFVLGEEVEKLEREIADYSGAKYAIGCASGSDAVYLALRAVGVGPGDRVATTPFTFFATAGSISRIGAIPVFVDIEPGSFNLDPRRLSEVLDRQQVKVIMPVHLYGGAADMDPILELAAERQCLVVEDGAQSIGAEYKGRRVNSLGSVGCISFFPSKNLGAIGDAGMTTTNDAALAETLSLSRVHGSRDRYYHDFVGVNSRIDALQAAVLRVKFRRLDDWTRRRQEAACVYEELLAGGPVTIPEAEPYQTRHVWHQYVIRCRRRDQLRDYLNENGVGSEVYYPLPLHLQACFSDLGYREGELPEAERAAKEVLALPVHPTLERAEIEYICRLIRSFYQ